MITKKPPRAYNMVIQPESPLPPINNTKISKVLQTSLTKCVTNKIVDCKRVINNRYYKLFPYTTHY